MNPIEITNNHTGKMEGIKSLSTSVLLNVNCQRNRKITGSICSHCYAESLAKMYTALGERLERNTTELTTRMLNAEDRRILKLELEKETIFRFEAFGDLNNELQLKNYLRICCIFPEIRFTLYTKQYGIIQKYFTTHDCPENLNIIKSSLRLNTKSRIAEYLERTGKFYPGQVKTFTVYDKKYLMEHPEVKINCGARSCNKCRVCYLKTEVTEINEILKSERESTEMIIKLRDPKEREKVIDILRKYVEV